jgi:hypothetical protein
VTEAEEVFGCIVNGLENWFHSDPPSRRDIGIKAAFYPRTYKALSFGVISFGCDAQPESRATIAASLPSTRKALLMFHEPFNED